MELAEENAMAERFEITDAMRAAIGKETAPWTYEVTTTSVRGFARVLLRRAFSITPSP